MSTAIDFFNLDDLHCYGCAHSASGRGYPGRPSGERPCCFCIRNKNREEPPIVSAWYDGSKPFSVPMDCYHSLDMKKQLEIWEDQVIIKEKLIIKDKLKEKKFPNPIDEVEVD